jgi:hypothetical protein
MCWCYDSRKGKRPRIELATPHAHSRQASPGHEVIRVAIQHRRQTLTKVALCPARRPSSSPPASGRPRTHTWTTIFTARPAYRPFPTASNPRLQLQCHAAILALAHGNTRLSHPGGAIAARLNSRRPHHRSHLLDPTHFNSTPSSVSLPHMPRPPPKT